LNKKVDFKQHISEMTHLHNVLRVFVRIWRQSQLYGTWR